MRTEGASLFNTDDALEIDGALVEELRRRAAEAGDGVFRACLHHSTEDAVQEMIVAMRPDHIRPPHCHPGNAESYLVLDGELTVFLFDNAGKATRAMKLAPQRRGQSFGAHIAAGLWHMLLPGPAGVVFYEAHAGPFRADTGNVWAAWAPPPHDRQALAVFARALGVRR